MNEIQLSTSLFKITCPACKQDNQLIAAQQSMYAICSHCKAYFNTLGVKRTLKLNQTDNFTPFLQTGKKIQLKTQEWTIAGIARYAEDVSDISEYWDCYFLFSPSIGWAYLYESEGHFLYAYDIDIFKQYSGYRFPGAVDFENRKYNKFTHYNFQPIAATGEFPGDISPTNKSVEFISPPYSINYYFNNDGLFIEKAEYIARDDIKIIEDTGIIWPSKPSYRHSIQPNPFKDKLKSVIFITILFNIIWLVSTILINQFTLNENVYQYTFLAPSSDSAALRDTALLSNKVQVSPSFKLEDDYSNLNFIIKTDVLQTWMGLDLNLVNEGTGEVYIVAKDIEYYSGYEGGESWSEGSQSAEALLGGIPPGTYHLEYQPTYATENITKPNWSINILKDVPIYSNWVFVFLLSLIIPLYYYLRSNNIEKNRWYDSEYNPYSSDT